MKMFVTKKGVVFFLSNDTLSVLLNGEDDWRPCGNARWYTVFKECCVIPFTEMEL